jgi:hypothetical protein
MKTLEELKEFYTNELSVDLHQLEQKRKQVMQNTLIAVGVIGILGLIVAGVMVSKGAPPPVFIFALVACVVIGAIAFSFIVKGYKREFKQRVIGRIVQFLDPGLAYQAQNCLNTILTAIKAKILSTDKSARRISCFPNYTPSTKPAPARIPTGTRSSRGCFSSLISTNISAVKPLFCPIVQKSSSAALEKCSNRGTWGDQT